MVKIVLKDGSERNYDKAMTAEDVAQSLSSGLASWKRLLQESMDNCGILTVFYLIVPKLRLSQEMTPKVRGYSSRYGSCCCRSRQRTLSRNSDHHRPRH